MFGLFWGHLNVSILRDIQVEVYNKELSIWSESSYFEGS